MITRKALWWQALVAAITTVVACACTGNSSGVSLGNTSKEVQAMNVGSKMVPSASSFTTAPLRNRLRVELKAPVTEVWAVLGDPARYPEYSSGLAKVETSRNSSGIFTAYVCHFKPQTQGEAGIVHRVNIPWYEPNRGYASLDEVPNAFGFTDAVTLVTVEPSTDGTIATWDSHYNAEDLDTNRTALDQALADIGDNLVRRFGGAVVTRYVDR